MFNNPRHRTDSEVEEQWSAFGSTHPECTLARRENVSGLLQSIVSSVRSVSDAKIKPMLNVDADRLWRVGIDKQRLASICDGFVVQSYFEDPDDAVGRVKPYLEQFGAYFVEIGLNGCFPFLKNPDDIREMMGALNAIGAVDFSFYNYGLMPHKHLGWIGRTR